ncbi:DedA family protein [Paraoerskovia marina]|uniref:DedA family protein n=1 Tax=Paraoerskovia marina TaxID=545619 RepID=UPI0009DD75E1|nr:DedA family protein [Paraoerskovia marina]
MLDPLNVFLADLEVWVQGIAASLWVYPTLFTFTVIDGFFPPVPSESVVITLSVAAAAGTGPVLWIIFVVAALGAWVGDQIAYLIGRVIGTERIPFLRSGRGLKAITWARNALATRGASFILAARYVPVGRVAVNMSAGAVGFPQRRFMAFSGIAAIVWASFSVGIGTLAGQWLGHNTLLAMVVGVGVGLLMGFVVDRLVVWWSGRGHALEPFEPLPTEIAAAQEDEHLYDAAG